MGFYSLCFPNSKSPIWIGRLHLWPMLWSNRISSLCFMNWRNVQHKHGGDICLYVANVQVSTSRLDIVNLCSAHRPKYHHSHIQLWPFPMGTTPSINLVTLTLVLEAVSCSCLFSEYPITKAWRCSPLGVLLKLPFFCVVPLLWSWNVLFWHGIVQYSK